VPHDVDHDAVRVPDEEPPDAPRLVGERMHDLVAPALRLGVRGVDVGHGDGDDISGAVGSLETMLTCTLRFVGDRKLATQPRSNSVRSPRNSS
jgi:hypothetical protein